MKITDILSHIDAGSMSLPRFQRGFVWGREQVRALFASLYRGHPIGSLLIWVTASETAEYRGDHRLAPGIVKLLLDGQQRITTLYSVARGVTPPFFDGDKRTLTGLRFHLDEQVFQFHQPVKMRDDARWIDITKFLQDDVTGILPLLQKVTGNSGELFAKYHERLTRLLDILKVDIPDQEVIGEDKTADVVVDIFNRVNSGGTKLSSGDLALAKICADWPEARDQMKEHVRRWNDYGYSFSLDWLLRCVNTVLTGRSEFHYLHSRRPDEIQDGMKRAVKQIDSLLDLIASRLGLDHARVFMGSYAIPVIARYLDQNGKKLSASDEGLLLFWFFQSGMWGRFSGSPETRMNRDIEALEQGGPQRLLEQLRLWRGGMRIEADHFDAGTTKARFYAVLYSLTRMNQARDFLSGQPIQKGFLAKINSLEVHHIFPKAALRKSQNRYSTAEVNALANFCFLTKKSNLEIGAKSPKKYFPSVIENHQGALESHCIPTDPHLWDIDNYKEFLRERRLLLAKAVNGHLASLLSGDTKWSAEFHGTAVRSPQPPVIVETSDTGQEERRSRLEDVRDWMRRNQLPAGEVSWDVVDESTGVQLAVVDLAWPEGIQVGRSEAVAILLDADGETLQVVNQAGFRCFTEVQAFKAHVERMMS